MTRGETSGGPIREAKFRDAMGDVLEAFDLHVSAASGSDAIYLYDSDGEYLFSVSPSISRRDLVALLQYGKQQFECGHKLGMAEIQQGFRALLGISQ